jgi:hypothetical protein
MFQEARHDCNQDKPDSCELDQIHHGAIECRQHSRNRQERSLSAHQIVVLDVGSAAFASLRVLLRHFAARPDVGPTRLPALLMAQAIYRSPAQPGNIDMLLFLALLVMLTKSLITLLATEVGSNFDAAVTIAGLSSYIGLFSYIFWPQTTTGKSFDCSRRGVSVDDGHLEIIDHLQQGIAVRPVGRPIAGSSLVRRLVRAKDDPAKQRIRAQLSDIDDARLFCLGLTSEDIAALRGTSSPLAEAMLAQGIDAPSEESGAYQISPPIAGLLDATDDIRHHESDAPRRESLSHVLSG